MGPQDIRKPLVSLAASIGATELAVFAVERFLFRTRLRELLHVRPGDASRAARRAAVAAFRDVIRPCIHNKKDGAICVSTDATELGHQYCLVALARNDQAVTAAAAFIVRRASQTESVSELRDVQRGVRNF